VRPTAALSPTLSLCVSWPLPPHARTLSAWGPRCTGRTLHPLDLADERSSGTIPHGIADAAAGFFHATRVYRMFIPDPVQIVWDGFNPVRYLSAHEYLRTYWLFQSTKILPTWFLQIQIPKQHAFSRYALHGAEYDEIHIWILLIYYIMLYVHLLASWAVYLILHPSCIIV
jgi:hypothetical protein